MLDIYRESGDSGDNLVSGFYYDQQIENTLTHVTLHCNTKQKIDGTWALFNNTTKEYSDEPLCQSIFTDDFSVTIANNWTDFGGNALGELWSQFKPMAPYVNELRNGIRNMVAKQPKEGEENILDSSMLAGGLRKGMKWLGEMEAKYGDKLVKYLNSALVVQGCRFSYYNGTGIAFSNLGMKFTIFPKYSVYAYPNDVLVSVETVNDQVNKLYPYFVGHYDESEIVKGTALDGFIAWQNPPAGFESGIKEITNNPTTTTDGTATEGTTTTTTTESSNPYPVDSILKGTLELRLGPCYRISNLVCADATFNFSKQMVKIVTDQFKPEQYKISPLYCDVSITLKPVTKYSDNALKNFALGFSSSSDGKAIENNNIEDFTTKLNDNLSRIKDQYKATYKQKD